MIYEDHGIIEAEDYLLAKLIIKLYRLNKGPTNTTRKDVITYGQNLYVKVKIRKQIHVTYRLPTDKNP